MLTIEQFNQLSNIEKYNLLESCGSYLECFRFDGPCKIALFDLYGYYVEVWLHIKSDSLLNAKAFTSLEKLDPYLVKIDISFLISQKY